MKKYLFKILKFGLVLNISLAAVLCCNPLTSPAFASQTSVSGTSQKSIPRCHHCKPTQTEDTCCIKKSQGEVLIKVSLNPPQVLKSFSTLISFNYTIPRALQAKFNLAFLDGPPGPVSEIPLYVSFHNFRI